jgi:hypothetical protein
MNLLFITGKTPVLLDHIPDHLAGDEENKSAQEGDEKEVIGLNGCTGTEEEPKSEGHTTDDDNKHRNSVNLKKFFQHIIRVKNLSERITDGEMIAATGEEVAANIEIGTGA